MNKMEAAAAFLEHISQKQGGFLADLMQTEMNPELISLMTNYAKACTQQVENIEDVAGSLMILGYLIRANETAQDIQADPAAH